MPSGIIKQKKGEFYTVRLLSVAGRFDTSSIKALAEVVERFALPAVHLTVRQGIEIPDVPGDALDAFVAALAEAGIELGLTGKRVRGTTACPGVARCRYGQIDSQGLAGKLHIRLRHRDGLPAKFKVAVAGCPNSCTKPLENDLGVIGTAKGFRLVVGGKMGKQPRMATPLPMTISSEDEVVTAAEQIVDWFARHGLDKERFGDTIDRLGVSSLQQSVV